MRAWQKCNDGVAKIKNFLKVRLDRGGKFWYNERRFWARSGVSNENSVVR